VSADSLELMVQYAEAIAVTNESTESNAFGGAGGNGNQKFPRQA